MGTHRKKTPLGVKWVAATAWALGCMAPRQNFADPLFFDVRGNPVPGDMTASLLVDWNPITNKADIRLMSVAALQSADQKTLCSGAWIETLGETKGKKPLVLTAASCPLAKIQTVSFSLPKEGSTPTALSFRIARFKSLEEEGISLALLELNGSEEILRQKGLQPFQLSPLAPNAGQRIEVVGFPSALQKAGSHVTPYRSRCRVLEPIPELHAGSLTLVEIWRHKCSAAAGMLGSPLLMSGTRQLVGLHQTSSDPHSADTVMCSSDMPCEAIPDALDNVTLPTFRLQTSPGYNYLQGTSSQARCLAAGWPPEGPLCP